MTVATELSTRTEVLGAARALELTAHADELIAAKGSKVVRIDLRKERPGRAELLRLLLGPTGNLRAPTLLKGRTLLIGFDEEAYRVTLR